MAKEMQQLPVQSPNPIPIASLGWWNIETLIDMAKLMFGLRILSMSCESIYRDVFVKRFFSILYSNVLPSSPVAAFM